VTGIGYGPIGENGIGGSTGGGIGVGGIGVGPIGGSTGHVSSSIGDSYQIERVNLPAVLEESYNIVVPATVADSYRVHVAPAIDSVYAIALASTMRAAYSIEVASRISDAYHIYVSSTQRASYHIRPGTVEVGDSYRILQGAILTGQYSIEYAGWLPTPATIVGAYEICQGALNHTLRGFPFGYGFRHDLTVASNWHSSSPAKIVFGWTVEWAKPLTIYRTEGTDTAFSLYVGKRCRADFQDLYFYDSDHSRRLYHSLLRTYYDESKQAEAAEISILIYKTSVLYTSHWILYYGLDHADPSPAWPADWNSNADGGWGVADFNCSGIGAEVPNAVYPPLGSYDIEMHPTLQARYQIHLAKIMEG